MLEEEIILKFNYMIDDFLNCVHHVYSNKFNNKIVEILLNNEDVLYKRLFFENFKDIQINDKKLIVNICLSFVVNSVYSLLEKVNLSKVNEIYNYAVNGDMYLIKEILDFFNDINTPINEELLYMLHSLNESEHILVSSLCSNGMSLSPDGVKSCIDKIVNEKDAFINDSSKYKDEVKTLLDIYVPLFINSLNNISYKNTPITISTKEEYVKIHTIADIYRDIVINIPNIPTDYYTIAKCDNSLIYYLIYQFLINFGRNPKYDYYTEMIKSILKNGHLNNKIDGNLFLYLIDRYKFAEVFYTLNENIEDIRRLRIADLNKELNFFATLDIAKYEQLKQKEKAFGLR